MSEHLGKIIADRITGITGIANQFVEYLDGTTQYSIQPRGDGKNMPDGYSVDVQSISVISSSGPDTVKATAPAETPIRLGDEVKNIITGFTGMVTRKVAFINGCVYFEVTGTVDKIGKTEELTCYANHTRWLIVDAQKFQRIREEASAQNSATAKAKPEPKKKAEKTTGGPSVRSASM